MNDTINGARKVVRSQNPVFFDSLLWVNRATDLEAYRPFCRFLHVLNDGSLIATDGARMHRAGPPHKQAKQWELDAGQYRVQINNANSLTLYPAGVIKGERGPVLPANALELLKLPENLPEPITWERKFLDSLTPADLYRLIVALGIEKNSSDREIGFNPDYLTDMVEKAHKYLYRINPNTLMARTPFWDENIKNDEGETVNVLFWPAYDAVLMGIVL